MAKTVDIRIRTTADLAGVQAIDRAFASITRAQKTSASAGSGAAPAFKATGQAAAAAERDTLRYANALASVQRASGDAAGVVRTYSTALKSITPNSIEALQATARLTQAQNALGNSARQASGGMAVLPRTIAGISHEAASMAKGMIGLGAAIGVVTTVVNSFSEAFQFKAELDATKQSITTLLGPTKDSARVFEEAAGFARQYGFTQEEITKAVSASVPIMRVSNATTEDTIAALARLAVLNPAEGIEGAAFALRELASGDITSLVERFNLSRDSARQMKDEIAGGKDAVAVLSKFLDASGVSMATLENRTKGTLGAMNELKQREEELALAQAKWAEGPGLTIVAGKTRVLSGLTRILTGDYDAMTQSISAHNAEVEAGFARNRAATFGYVDAVAEAEAEARRLAGAQAHLADEHRQAESTADGAAAAASHLASEHATGGQAANQARIDYAGLREEMTKLAQAGEAALGQALATQTEFASRVVEVQAEAEDKITELQADRAKARTAKERESIDERIAAVKEGLNAQLVAQAEAFAAEEAAQREHLGRQLIEYARAQAELNGVSEEKTRELTDRIAAQYGVQQDLSERAFGAMKDDIASWAQAGGDGANELASRLNLTSEQATELARTMDEAAKARRLELITDFEKGKINLEELTEALAKVPAEITTEFQDNFPDGMDRANDLAAGISDIERQVRTEYGDNFHPGTLRAMELDNSIKAIPKAVTVTANDNLDQAERHAKDLKRAVDNIPTQKTVTVTVRNVTDAAEGVGGGAGPGAQGVRGAGGNAGLRGFKGASAGGGGGSVQDAIDTLNDAAEIIKVIKPFVAANRGAVKLLNEYALTVKSAVASLLAIQDLRARLVAPAPVLDVNQVLALKNDIERVLSIMMSIDASATTKVRVFAKYLETEKSAVEILNTVMELRKNLSMPTPPIDMNYVLTLIATANAVIALLFSQLIPLKQREVDGLRHYADAAQAGINVLSGMAELRKDLAELKDVAPINMALIQALMQRANEITRMLQTQLVPLTEEQAAAFEAYAGGVGAGVEILTNIADLRKELSGQKDVSPFNMNLIRALAQRAREITQAVLKQLVPLTEDQADAATRFADAAGSSVDALKSVLELPAKMFTDYKSPTNAQIGRVVADTNRIIRAVDMAARAYSTDGLEAVKAFGEATGAVLGAFKDQLLFAQAIGSGDFIIDPRNLAKFEQGMKATIAVAGRLGAQAVAIPAGNIAALQAVAAANTASYESLIKLSAVPFGNLPQLTSQYAQQGGGMGAVNVTINTLPGQNANQIADMVIGRLNKQVGARR